MLESAIDQVEGTGGDRNNVIKNSWPRCVTSIQNPREPRKLNMAQIRNANHESAKVRKARKKAEFIRNAGRQELNEPTSSCLPAFLIEIRLLLPPWDTSSVGDNSFRAFVLS